MTQLFEVSGLSLDANVSILYGAVVPGASDETIAAPVGSLYLCTDGLTYKKLTEGAGGDKWVTEFETGILSLPNVPATTPTVLDSLDGANVETAVWTVSVASVATPATRETIMVTGSHNGVTAKFSVYSRLQFGAKQANTYAVVYTGGFLQLTVAPEFVSNVECYRLTTVSHGTVQITGGSGAAAPLTNASPTTLGGVKVGSGLAIDGAGVLSVTSSGGATNLGATPDATTVALTSSSGSGVSIPAATTTAAGVLTAEDKAKLDILANSPALPIASDAILGGIRIGSGLTIDANGIVTSSTSFTQADYDSLTALVQAGLDVDSLVQASLLTKADSSALTTVQNDLLAQINAKPTLPQVAASLATVATTGSYTDLLNKPTNLTLASYYTTFGDADLVADEVTITHNLGEKYVIAQVYDETDSVVLPKSITLIDANTLKIKVTPFAPLGVGITWKVRVDAPMSNTQGLNTPTTLTGYGITDAMRLYEPVSLIATTGNSLSLPTNTGNYFVVTLNGHVSPFTLTGTHPSATSYTCTVEFYNPTANTLTVNFSDASLKKPYGVGDTFSVSALQTVIVMFNTRDGGLIWRVFPTGAVFL